MAVRECGPLAGLFRLLAWYEATPVLRALVRYVPFGAGAAVDVALVAAFGMIRGRSSPRR